MDTKRPTPRHIIIKMPKVKNKERILKAARERQLVTCRGVPIRLSSNFSKKIFAGKKGLARNIQSHEKQDIKPRLLNPHSYYLELKDRESASQTRKN